MLNRLSRRRKVSRTDVVDATFVSWLGAHGPHTCDEAAAALGVGRGQAIASKDRLVRAGYLRQAGSVTDAGVPVFEVTEKALEILDEGRAKLEGE